MKSSGFWSSTETISKKEHQKDHQKTQLTSTYKTITTTKEDRTGHMSY